MKKSQVLITGGNGDLALEISRHLQNDMNVLLPTKSELDVSSPVSVENFFRDKEFDVVVNCAGTLYSSCIRESDPNKWVNDINVNLIGCYLVCREALIKKSTVKIVNISSTAAFNSYKDWTSYCAAKAGVIKLSLGLVKDNYDVIIMCPGAIDTKLRDGLNISNPNIMSLSEGVSPIINAIRGKYNRGDIIFYRKNEFKIIKDYDGL